MVSFIEHYQVSKIYYLISQKIHYVIFLEIMFNQVNFTVVFVSIDQKCKIAVYNRKISTSLLKFDVLLLFDYHYGSEITLLSILQCNVHHNLYIFRIKLLVLLTQEQDKPSVVKLMNTFCNVTT